MILGLLLALVLALVYWLGWSDRALEQKAIDADERLGALHQRLLGRLSRYKRAARRGR